MQTYEVIVVGAGYAGLTTARNLIRGGKKVLLLEARDRVGGRVHTHREPQGYYIDKGAGWIGPTQDRMYALLKEFDIASLPTYDKGKSIFYYNKKTKGYKGLIPPVGLHHLIGVQLALNKINKLSRKVNLQAPWETPNAEQLDAINAEEWMHKQMPKSQVARDIFKLAFEAVWAAHPREVSLLHTLFYTKSGGNIERLTNVKNGAQQDRIQGGSDGPARAIAQQIKAHIQLHTKVIAVEQDSQGVKIITDKGDFFAQKVVIAIPPIVADDIKFMPALPQMRQSLQQNMPMGKVWKTFMVYQSPFWRKMGYNGMITAPQEHISVVFDNSPKDESVGILMGFVSADAASYFITLSQHERKVEVLKAYSRYFGEAAQNPIAYHDHCWTEDPLTKGCYVGIMPPLVMTTYGAALRRPVGNIHWAGTETSEIWNGYMEGAVRSGERVADELLAIM